jgi:hypothetical protein
MITRYALTIFLDRYVTSGSITSVTAIPAMLLANSFRILYTKLQGALQNSQENPMSSSGRSIIVQRSFLNAHKDTASGIFYVSGDEIHS